MARSWWMLRVLCGLRVDRIVFHVEAGARRLETKLFQNTIAIGVQIRGAAAGARIGVSRYFDWIALHPHRAEIRIDSRDDHVAGEHLRIDHDGGEAVDGGA